jgi:anti-sigma factor RsiW
MTPCPSAVPWERLVDYWAGDLAPDDESAIEDHLMGCEACTAASSRVAAVTEAIRAMIPLVVTREMVDALRARGYRVQEGRFAPGDRREVVFPEDVDLMIFHLAGLDLAGVARLDMTMRSEGSADVLTAVEDAPFDREAGEVLLCCQRHFASFPPDVVAELRLHPAAGEPQLAAYTILHRFAKPLSREG